MLSFTVILTEGKRNIENFLRVYLKLRKKQTKCYNWSIALYGAKTWTLRAVDQKYLESFEM